MAGYTTKKEDHLKRLRRIEGPTRAPPATAATPSSATSSPASPRCARAPAITLTGDVVHGAAGEGSCAADADLLVIGAAGHGRLTAALLGSVSAHGRPPHPRPPRHRPRPRQPRQPLGSP